MEDREDGGRTEKGEYIHLRELRIRSTYILTDTLLVHALQRRLCKQKWAATLRWSEDQTAGQHVS